MKPSSALIIGGAYLSYTIASWSPERREAVVQMIRDGVSGAVNAFLEDPVGCLRRFWDEKKRSPMLLLALASKLMADNLRRKRLKREAAAAPAVFDAARGRPAHRLAINQPWASAFGAAVLRRNRRRCTHYVQSMGRVVSCTPSSRRSSY